MVKRKFKLPGILGMTPFLGLAALSGLALVSLKKRK